MALVDVCCRAAGACRFSPEVDWGGLVSMTRYSMFTRGHIYQLIPPFLELSI